MTTVISGDLGCLPDLPELDTDVLPPIHGRPPYGHDVLPPWPIEPQRAEPAAEQAARLLAYLADLLDARRLDPPHLFVALATANATRGPLDHDPGIEPFARWIALKSLGKQCRRHAEYYGWAAGLGIGITTTARPGDWLHGLITRYDPKVVAGALRAAAETARG